MKRIWLTAVFLFVTAGAIGCFFNAKLEGAYPVVQFFTCGFFTALVYFMFTVILSDSENELKTVSKVFLALVEVFTAFAAMACTAVIYTKNETTWWMCLTWAIVAVCVGIKSYIDAKKVNI